MAQIENMKMGHTRKWPLLLAQTDTLSLASVPSLATLSDARLGTRLGTSVKEQTENPVVLLSKQRL